MTTAHEWLACVLLALILAFADQAFAEPGPLDRWWPVACCHP